MRRWPAIVTAVVFAVSSIPYVYGTVRQTTDERFTWIVFDVVDTAQYFAWMRAFAASPLIANPLTPEPGADRFFNLQWWLLGLIAFAASNCYDVSCECPAITSLRVISSRGRGSPGHARRPRETPFARLP